MLKSYLSLNKNSSEEWMPQDNSGNYDIAIGRIF